MHTLVLLVGQLNDTEYIRLLPLKMLIAASVYNDPNVRYFVVEYAIDFFNKIKPVQDFALTP